MGLAIGIGISPTLREGAAYDPVAALGADLYEYWDAEQVGSPLTLSGDKVVTWTSGKSGLAPTQATDSARPTYDASGLNGRPCLVFDSALSQQLAVGGVGNMPTGSAECEVWLLGSQDLAATTAGGRVAFSYGNGGVAGQYRSVGRTTVSTVNRVNVVAGTGAADVGATGTLVDMTGVCLIRGRMLASEIDAFLNGIDEGSAAIAMAGTATTRTRIGAYPNSGGAFFWHGKIAAIYVTAPLNDNKAVPLASYFAQRGGF